MHISDSAARFFAGIGVAVIDVAVINVVAWLIGYPLSWEVSLLVFIGIAMFTTKLLDRLSNIRED